MAFLDYCSSELASDQLLLFSMACPVILEILNSKSSEKKLSAIKSALNTSHHEHENLDKQTVLLVLNELSNFGYGFLIFNDEDRELSTEDFPRIEEKAVLVFKCIQLILSHTTVRLSKEDFIPVIVFCFQFISPDFLWSTNQSKKYCDDTLNILLEICSSKNIVQFLNNEEDNVFLKKLFASFRPHLTSSNWKKNPGMKYAFQICLSSLKFPFGVDVLDTAVTASLLFVDDFMVENRLIGINCLQCLLNITPVGDLRRNGHIDLIYSALKNIVYLRDATIISAIYPCLFKVFSITQPNPQKPAPIRKINQYDLLLTQLLNDMDNEQTISLRQVYSNHLNLFIDAMGLTIVRHLKPLITVLMQYLEIYDDENETTRLNCLTCLEKLIETTQPRIDNYIVVIVKGIVRLLYVIEDNNSKEAAKIEIRKRCIIILKLLDMFNSVLIDEICQPLLNITDKIPALNIIKEVWTTNV